MKKTAWTRLMLISAASALLIIPVANCTSAIADDNNVTISEVRGSDQPATPGKIADEPRGENMDRQPLDRKQSPGPVVNSGPDRPVDTSPVRVPRPHCKLGFSPAWSTPLWTCS